MNVSHVNVRQSLAIMLSKLIFVELMSFGLLTASCALFSCYLFSLATFAQIFFFMSAKLYLTITVILQWMYEYYEITSEGIIHRKGIFYETKELQQFKHLASAGIDQGLLGRIFNFGTIKVYNKDTASYFTMYLIHNPQRYYKLIKKLHTSLDEEGHTFRKELVHAGKDY